MMKNENTANIYFLYGNEKYLLKKFYDKLVKKSVPKNFTEFNLNEFTNESTVDDIADAVYALPFMAEQKCVIVKDFDVDKKNSVDISKLEELISDPVESTVLIFTLPTLVVDTKKSAKWRNFIKLVKKHGQIQQFEKQELGDLSKFIIKNCEKHGSRITRQNANLIVEYAGSDMKNLENECSKLSAFAGEREITRDDIENLVVKNLETTVFILIKAIIASDIKKAYSLLYLLFSMGEEPFAILARISDTYVDLYRVRAALQSGKSARAPAEYGEYKGREFRLTNAQRDIRNLSTEKLVKSLDLLRDTDLLLKSSKMNGKVVMETLIVKLLLIRNE